MYQQRPRDMPGSPFIRPERDPRAIFDATVNDLARKFIYHTGDLKPTDIERAIDLAATNPVIQRIEEERGDLEALKELLQGISEHERANDFHLGAWQAELARRAKPETLTREEISEMFESFKFKKPLEFAEKRAVEHYEALLAISPDTVIKLSENIRLERSDIEVLLIDIKTRIVERMTDPTARRAGLEDLDRELADLIARIPKEHAGKKFELEEIYLLRRLIHNADTGHLASVSHGTPREDLRSDRGVDIVVATAGDVYEFQLKTFRSGTDQAAKEMQAEVRARAERNLRGSRTHLVELKAEAVRETFERSLRQAHGTRHTLADKFAALEPITHDLTIKERERLLKLIGLTEEDLAREQKAFDERQAAMTAHGAELRQKRQEEERRIAEAEARREADERAVEGAERARLERIARHEQEQREASERKRAAEVAAANAKQMEREKKLAEEAAQRRREQEEAAAKAAKAETKAAKDEEKKWAQQKLAELGKPDALIAQELLAAGDRNNLTAILAAKKLLAAKYPNTKSILKDFPMEK